MALRINLKNDINNTSLQIGDTAYYISNVTSMDKFGLGTNPGISPEEINSPKPIGIITSIGGSNIIIETIINTPPDDAFIMFQKDKRVNDTSLLGYYAEVKLVNNSTEKAELFALSSEIAMSSK